VTQKTHITTPGIGDAVQKTRLLRLVLFEIPFNCFGGGFPYCFNSGTVNVRKYFLEIADPAFLTAVYPTVGGVFSFISLGKL
jgi:hypothetical protein